MVSRQTNKINEADCNFYWIFQPKIKETNRKKKDDLVNVFLLGVEVIIQFNSQTLPLFFRLIVFLEPEKKTEWGKAMKGVWHNNPKVMNAAEVRSEAALDVLNFIEQINKRVVLHFYFIVCLSLNLLLNVNSFSRVYLLFPSSRLKWIFQKNNSIKRIPTLIPINIYTGWSTSVANSDEEIHFSLMQKKSEPTW